MKWKQILSILVAGAIGITSLSGFTSPPTNDITTIREVSGKLSYTNKDIFPAMQASGGEYDGHYAYCLQHNASTPGTGGTGYESGDELDAHIAYITGYGLVSDSQRGDERYQTGDTLKDYYITQLAVHVYLGQVNFNNIRGDADVIQRAQNLYNDAMGYNGGEEITVSPRNLDFNLEGDNFVTPWYSVNINGDCYGWDVDLRDAPPNTVVDKQGHFFRLIVNKANVAGNTDVKIRVKGTFSKPSTFEYVSSNPSVQITTISRDPIVDVGDYDFSYAHLNAIGNLQVNKTCEEFDVVTQQSNYTTLDAGGKQFQADGGTPSNGFTDGNGYLLWQNVLMGNYNVYEQNTPAQYVQPSTQNVYVPAGQTGVANVQNTLKKGRVGFIKKCTYYGNVRVKGAVYGVYRASDNALLETLTSDADYVYTDKLLPYGMEGYLQEITPPEFYAPDDTKYPFVVTENDQKIDIVAWNTPYSEVWPEFIEPNSDYRNNTDIIASYYIHNNSIAERRPNTGQGNVSPLTVDFTATDENGTIVSKQTKDVNVPRFDQNLVYFNLHVPENAGKLHFECTIRDPEGVVETGNNHTAINDFILVQPSTQNTPDTKFENVPTGFSVPSKDMEVPSGDLAKSVTNKASWQQWEWENNTFALKTYGLQLSTKHSVSPDPVVKTAIKTENGYQVKSGYGFTQSCISSVSAQEGMIMPTAQDYYLPQNGNAYYPEFQYLLSDGSYTALDHTSSDTLEMRRNPYTTSSDGQQDFRRVHFMPIWFPDGDYVLKSYVYDCWTPAGMLSCKDTVESISVGGDVYDDWYIGHK